jgi:ATP-binding cassette subfamily B protein
MKKSDRTVLRFLREVAGNQKIHLFTLSILQMLLGLGDVALAWMFRGMIDQAVAKDAQGFCTYVVGIVLLTLLRAALCAVARHILEYTRSTLENRLKERLFFTLLTRDYGSVSGIHSGEWMNRLTSDAATVADELSTILPELLGMLVKLLGASALMVYLLPGFAWILVPGGAIILILSYAFRKRLKSLYRRIREADGALRVFLSERLSSLLVVRSFAREEQTVAEAREKMKAHQEARMKRNRVSNFCNLGFGLLMRGAYLCGAFYCGYGILMGTMSYGTFVAVLQLVGQIQSPFANLTGYLPKYYAMLTSAERLMEAETFQARSAKERSEEQVKQLYETLHSIQFQSATFSYAAHGTDKDGKAGFPVIDGFDFTIQKGEYVAITGPSGCGKSTLLKLVMSLYPLDGGERSLELHSGEKIPLDGTLIRLFAYTPQGNQLMSGTIREVVTFGGSGNDAAVWRALRIACAEPFVRQLPEGLDTQLGERGAGLSEGQMQRLAIARAIYSDHPILLLDEATSALDEQTEQQLLYNLRAMTDKTVLIVTHRPASLEICDRQVDFSESLHSEQRVSA